MRTFLCRELGGADFTIDAKDLKQAKMYAEMYGAVVIKELK